MEIQKILKKIFGGNNAGKVVTRIAPSPTGNLHVGTARSALFNYLYAKKHNGTFIVRIEDTDKERSTKEFEQNILDGLSWLGIESDSLFRQSDRVSIYKKYLEKLISSGKAYISEEKEGDRGEVIRFKNPNKKITFEDEIRGSVTFDTTELGDFVIAKAVDEPLYHLAAVVDDHEMGVTHIIRGEDHISNTPRQILIQEAIGAKRPIYAHMPLILGKDKSKLSKRSGATAINEYEAKGILPVAMSNFLAFLGWNPGTDQEIFSREELIEAFDLKKIQKGGAIFNEEKLMWFNKEHIKQLPVYIVENKLRETLGHYKPTEQMVEMMLPIVTEKISTFADIDKMLADGEFEYYFKQPLVKIENLKWKGEGDFSVIVEHLSFIEKTLSKLPETQWSEESVKNALWDYATEKGRGEVLWPFRYLLTGKDKSPAPFIVAAVIGKEKTVARVHATIEHIREA